MAKSIIQEDRSHCYICGRNGYSDPLDCHHVFFGTANRSKSEQYGLKVYICHNRCHIFGENAVHRNADVCRAVQAKAQEIAMKHYGWNVDQFRHIFGKSYL